MSAIFGILPKHGVTERDIFQLNTAKLALSLHGSDFDGIWHDTFVGIGQCMQCYTPQDYFEKQPVVDSESGVVLVSDARIDNRIELSRQLEIDFSDATIPDSSYILAAYKKWSFNCPKHLIGAFACAVWDPRIKKLFLFRSKLGERPLYFGLDNDHFVFSSMPKGVLATLSLPREVNEEYLARYMVNAPRDPSSTFFKHVRRLPPASSMVVDRHNHSIEQYWQPDYDKVLKFASDQDYLEAADDLLTRVISDHCRSAGDVGVMMSGGLDSATVAAFRAISLQERPGQKLKTFTEVPFTSGNAQPDSSRYLDETPLVEAISRMYDNIDARYIKTAGKNFLADIDRFFNATEMPFRNASNRVWMEELYSQAQKESVSVLLTGVPGNLTISWEGHGLLPDLAKTWRLWALWRELCSLKRNGAIRSRLYTFAGKAVLPFLPVQAQSAIMAMRNGSFFPTRMPWEHFSTINPEFARLHQLKELYQIQDAVHFASKREFNRLRHRVFEQVDGYCDLLAGFSARYHIDTRDPLGDVRILEFSLSLPESQFLHNGIPRSLVRRLMKNRLPEEIVTNMKRGLQSPNWLEAVRGALPDFEVKLQQMMLSSHCITYLDLTKLRKCLERVSNSNAAFNDRFIIESGMMTGQFLRWIENEA